MLTTTQPQIHKTDIGWCHSHQGMHERKATCSGWRHETNLIACDAHGDKPHRQNEMCVVVREADPFYGF
jgi:hypothetical protein